MAKLPEDVKLAVEGLRTLEEKFLNPLRRLQDVVRLCVESENRVEEAEKKFGQVQSKIVELQNLAHQQEERSKSRLKSTLDQLATVQAQWSKAEIEHKQKLADAEERLGELNAEYTTRCQRRDDIAAQIVADMRRLEELRERIRRAQTMEP